VHVIGKDIVRFHAVYWPAMLLSVGAPPPTTIVVHGFLTRDGRRMSKTLGTGVDPTKLVQRWGADAVRYWLLREVPPTGDADYTDAGFARVYAADLANDLGNLLQRTVSMIHRYRDGAGPGGALPAESSLAGGLAGSLDRALGDGWDPRLALDAIFAVVRRANQHVEETKPWALARAERAGDVEARRRLDTVLSELVESLRLVAEALRPLLPDTAGRIAEQLGITPGREWARAVAWGAGATGTRVGTPVPLFPAVSDRAP
jgi:methionyl-tRNA synthetase